MKMFVFFYFVAIERGTTVSGFLFGTIGYVLIGVPISINIVGGG